MELWGGDESLSLLPPPHTQPGCIMRLHPGFFHQLHLFTTNPQSDLSKGHTKKSLPAETLSTYLYSKVRMFDSIQFLLRSQSCLWQTFSRLYPIAELYSNYMEQTKAGCFVDQYQSTIDCTPLLFSVPLYYVVTGIFFFFICEG